MTTYLEARPQVPPGGTGCGPQGPPDCRWGGVVGDARQQPGDCGPQGPPKVQVLATGRGGESGNRIGRGTLRLQSNNLDVKNNCTTITGETQMAEIGKNADDKRVPLPFSAWAGGTPMDDRKGPRPQVPPQLTKITSGDANYDANRVQSNYGDTSLVNKSGQNLRCPSTAEAAMRFSVSGGDSAVLTSENVCERDPKADTNVVGEKMKMKKLTLNHRAASGTMESKGKKNKKGVKKEMKKEKKKMKETAIKLHDSQVKWINVKAIFDHKYETKANAAGRQCSYFMFDRRG